MNPKAPSPPIQHWLDRLATGLLLTPVILVPLVFSETGTNTLVIKEPVFQISTALLLLLFPFTSVFRQGVLKPYCWLLLLMGGYALISALVVAPHPRAWVECIRWLAYLSFSYMTAVLCLNTKRLKLFVTVTLMTSALVSLYAIAQAFEIEPFLAWETFAPDGSDIRRVCSSLCNPDFLAGYLVGLIPFTIAIAVFHQGAIRAGCSLLVALQLFALFFTYSRGGWAATLAVLLLFSFVLYFRPISENQRPRFSLKHGAGAAVVALLLIAIVPIFLREQLEGWLFRFSNLSSDMSIQSRSYYYLACLQMWLDRPITGHGIGTFALHFHDFRPKELAQLLTFRLFHVDHAHNEWLQILAETGLIGITLYSVIIGSSLRACWKASKTAASSTRGVILGLGLGATAILIHNLFTVTLRYTPSALLLWSFLGAAAACAAAQIPCKPNSANGKRAAAVLLFIFAPVLFYYSMNFYVGDRLIQEGKARLYSKIHYQQSREENRLEMQRALVSLYKAIELSPSRIEAHFYIGLCYNKAFDYPRADEVYQQLQTIHPHFTAVLMNLSINQLQWAEFINNPAYYPEGVRLFTPLMVDEIQKAVEWTKRGELDDPYDPVYPHLLGRGLFFLGEFDQAKSAFQRTIDNSMALSEDMYRNEISDSKLFLEKINAYQTQE